MPGHHFSVVTHDNLHTEYSNRINSGAYTDQPPCPNIENIKAIKKEKVIAASNVDMVAPYLEKRIDFVGCHHHNQDAEQLLQATTGNVQAGNACPGKRADGPNQD